MSLFLRKKYNTKWSIVYKGKDYISIYGKKKAYDMYVMLSANLDGLEIVPASKREKTPLLSDKAKNDYNRRWRAKYKDRVKEYNRKYYLSRKKKQGPPG